MSEPMLYCDGVPVAKLAGPVTIGPKPEGPLSPAARRLATAFDLVGKSARRVEAELHRLARSLVIRAVEKQLARKKTQVMLMHWAWRKLAPPHIRTDRRGRWHARDGRYLKRVAKDPA